MSSQDESGVTMKREVLTPQPRSVLFHRERGHSTATLAATLTNWSAEQDGLRLGMRILAPAGWRLGGHVGVELWVANMSPQEVKFGHSGRTDAGLSVIARDKDGKEHSADITQYRGMLFYLPWRLPPSHSVKVKEFNVRFDPPGTPGEHGRDAVFQLAPGDYKLNCVRTTSRLPNAPAGDWDGKLTSSEMAVKLLPAATNPTMKVQPGEPSARIEPAGA